MIKRGIRGAGGGGRNGCKEGKVYRNRGYNEEYEKEVKRRRDEVEVVVEGRCAKIVD